MIFNSDKIQFHREGSRLYFLGIKHNVVPIETTLSAIRQKSLVLELALAVGLADKGGGERHDEDALTYYCRPFSQSVKSIRTLIYLIPLILLSPFYCNTNRPIYLCPLISDTTRTVISSNKWVKVDRRIDHQRPVYDLLAFRSSTVSGSR